MLTLGERISDIERQNLSSLFCQEPKEIPKNSITHFHVTLFIFRYTIGKMKEEREKNVSNVVPSPERGGQYLNLSLSLIVSTSSLSEEEIYFFQVLLFQVHFIYIEPKIYTKLSTTSASLRTITQTSLSKRKKNNVEGKSHLNTSIYIIKLKSAIRTQCSFF